jgi:PAS domain-containing protein
LNIKLRFLDFRAITGDKGAARPHYALVATPRGRRLAPFYLKDTKMTAGQRADEQKIDAIPRDSQARQLLDLESDAMALRADNAALRAQLALRDHALDSTPTFFVITRQETPAPIIVYCNKVVAEQQGLVREELIGKPITLLTQWVGSKDGAGILRLVLEYDAQIAQGHNPEVALSSVRAQSGQFDSKLIENLESLVGLSAGAPEVKEVPVGRVTPGMVFMDDLYTQIGTLLVPKGFEVTEAFLERARNFGPGILQEKVRVLAPVKSNG